MLPALPHAYPFRLIDAVVSVDRDRATVRRRITADDPLVGEGGSLMPPLLLEVIAQCAGIAAVGPNAGGSGMLVAVNRFRCAGRVGAGDSLEVAAQVVRRFGAMVKARGRVRADGRLRAVGEVVIQLVPS